MSNNRDKGFASMDKHTLFKVTSAGGKAAHAKRTAHEWTREEARAAGRRGGRVLKGSKYAR